MSQISRVMVAHKEIKWITKDPWKINSKKLIVLNVCNIFFIKNKKLMGKC